MAGEIESCKEVGTNEADFTESRRGDVPMTYYYTDAGGRGRFIAGLRDLAAFLESNPGVPVPRFTTTVFLFPPDGTDQERRAEIDVIASQFSTQAYSTQDGYYEASRFFGPVEYRAVAIPRESSSSPDGE